MRKNRSKRFLTFALAAGMIFANVPAVFAEEAAAYEQLEEQENYTQFSEENTEFSDLEEETEKSTVQESAANPAEAAFIQETITEPAEEGAVQGTAQEQTEEISWEVQPANSGYTGLVDCGNNVWQYQENGAVNWEYTGLVYHYGSWFYVENGILNWNYTGLTLYYGTWYYVENGVLNWNYTGLTLYYGTWYYVENGVLNWDYTGLTLYYDSWYYVENGVLNWSYTGLAYHYGTWYYVENGILNWGYTGLCLHSGSWFYVNNGSLDWSYTGITEYYGTKYYVQNGYLDWSFSGIITYNNKEYYVEGAVLQGRRVSASDFYQYLMENAYISDTAIRDDRNIVEFIQSLQEGHDYEVGTIDQLQYGIEIIRSTNKVRAASGRSELFVDPVAMVLSLEQLTWSTDQLIAGNGLQHHTLDGFFALGISAAGENAAQGYLDPVQGWFTDEASAFAWYLIDNKDAVVWKDGVTTAQMNALVNELSNAQTSWGYFGRVFDDELLYKMTAMVDATSSSSAYYQSGATSTYGQIGHYVNIVADYPTAIGSVGIRSFTQNGQTVTKYLRYSYTAVQNLIGGKFKKAGSYKQMSADTFEALLNSYISEANK